MRASPAAEHCLIEIDRRLRKRYGTRPLGNKADPLDELIYIQLSIRTRESAYAGGYEALRGRVGGNWRLILDLPPEDLERLIQPGGMGTIKMERLRGQIAAIVNRFGRASLDDLRSMSDAEVEAFLLGLPGVGPKAARCVMLYSLDRAVFPVDSHCRRVMDRLGYLPAGVDRKSDHDILQEVVPESIRPSLHINLVHHGRALCLPRSPACEACPVRDLCPTGLGRT